MRRLLQGSAPPPPFQSAFSGLSHHFGVWWPVCSSRSSSRASRDTCSAWRPHGGRRARSLRSTHEGGLVQIARRASTRTCSRQWISQGPQSRSRSLPFVGSDRPPPLPQQGAPARAGLCSFFFFSFALAALPPRRAAARLPVRSRFTTSTIRRRACWPPLPFGVSAKV
jgi:hypothetical protein